MAHQLGKKQRGSALVVALFVFSLAVITTVAMTSRQAIDIRRSSNLFEAEQSLLYTTALEGWAGSILVADAKQNKIDHLNEVWATKIQPFPVDGGQIVASLTDLQSRFNLNNLVQGEQVNAKQVEYFKRLLFVLEIEANITEAVIDWIDSNHNLTFPDGAEETEYLGIENPYRTANVPFASTSELMLVKGVTAEIMRKLRPHVSALPDLLPINVNTAGPIILQALAPSMTTADVKALIEGRGNEGYGKTSDFLRQDIWRNRPNENKPDGGLIGVKSDYFLLIADAQIAKNQMHLESTIKRNDKGFKILKHSWGE